MKPLQVQVWSDIACPWCYVGKRRLATALAAFTHRDDANVRWRAFELDPTAPRVRDEGGPYAERLARKYGMSRVEADERLRHLTDVAAAEGLRIAFDSIRPGNTFDAHRLIAFARTRGLEDAAKERLMRAYFTEGRSVGDRGVLAELGEEVGIPGADVADVLAGDAFSVDVRVDEKLARDRGISGVPFFVVGERLAVSGAQPASVLAAALERAWAEGPGAPRPAGASAGDAPVRVLT